MRCRIRWIVRYEFESHYWPLNMNLRAWIYGFHYTIWKPESCKKYLSSLSPTSWYSDNSGKWSFSLGLTTLVGNHNVICKWFCSSMAVIDKNYFLIPRLLLYICFKFHLPILCGQSWFCSLGKQNKVNPFVTWQSFKCLNLSIIIPLKSSP